MLNECKIPCSADATPKASTAIFFKFNAAKAEAKYLPIHAFGQLIIFYYGLYLVRYRQSVFLDRGAKERIKVMPNT
jgi:hypothetical protein